jgi:hypothetical protein
MCAAAFRAADPAGGLGLHVGRTSRHFGQRHHWSINMGIDWSLVGIVIDIVNRILASFHRLPISDKGTFLPDFLPTIEP